MAKNNEAVEGLGLLVLRLAVGGMMLTHGLPKLQRLLEKPDQFPDPIGLGPEVTLAFAVFSEVICAVLIIAGAATRLAAIPLLITMLVAAFVTHAGDPFNKMEPALLYGSCSLALVLTGAGKFSVDGWWNGRG
ncbi:MAG: DoxX family protein [Candidatus Binatia bacterium]|jgi:putative oxidoreductase|nr:DoxX family protein [Candidatus Binatia bacterium]MDG2009875.1 DoxX family protein [Candidatus Binatia bacterium]HAC80460.1 DoxX family protein [Deltaproteobacteria bacterium]|tara:strand:- start:84 stop:482 length:399 start_codon:yes stop_codon:yes gene_type:complete